MLHRSHPAFAVALAVCLASCGDSGTSPEGGPPPTGSHVWSAHYTDTSCWGIDTDASRNVIVAGTLTGTADFGGGPLTARGLYDIYLAKFSPDGRHIWSKRFGGDSQETILSFAVDLNDDLLLTGEFVDSLDLGGGPLVGSGGVDIVLAKLSGGGAHVWSRRFGGGGSEHGDAIAVDGFGNVFMGGRFNETLDLGGAELESPGNVSLFLAKFDPNGTHLWSIAFGEGQNLRVFAAGTDGMGNVVITGGFDSTIDLGGGMFTSMGQLDIFVAKFDANGSHVWSRHFGDANADIASCCLVSHPGDVTFSGYFGGTIDFGGGTLTSAGTFDTYLAQLDAGGNLRWARRYGDAASQITYGLAGDAVGNIVLTGYLQGTVDFGGGPLTSAGNGDIFVAKLAHDGAYIWAQRYGDIVSQSGARVACDRRHSIVVGGSNAGTIDFGGGPLTGNINDMFVVKFDG